MTTTTMKVKMLALVHGEDKDYEKDHVYTFPLERAKSLIAKDKAIEVKGGDGATALDGFAETIQKAIAAGFAAGAEAAEVRAKAARKEPPGGGAVHQGEYSNIEPDFKGLPIFRSAGGFLHAVRDLSTGAPEDDTIRKMGEWKEVQRKTGADVLEAEVKAPSGNFENNDPDGGALVIPEFSQTIYDRMQLEENFLADSNNLVIRGNTLTMPALDDSSRVDGSRYGAVLGAWIGEAAQLANVSKIQVRQMDFRLKKLYIFAYITDELLADSPYAVENYTSKCAAKELAFKTNDAMIRGNGGGMPTGILNSPSLITVASEAGQQAKTILLQNIENMWMRLNYYCRKDAVWLINQDCEKQLQMMGFPVGIAGVPIYQPQGGVSNPAYSTLKGRPVKVVEFCETLGTPGDILLTSWSHYQAITKGGIQSDISMHVRFLFGEMAYRFTYRMDGKPLWDKPLTPYKGTNTTSPSIALAAR